MTGTINELLIAQGGLRLPGIVSAASLGTDAAGNVQVESGAALHGIAAYSALAKRLANLKHLWLLNETSGTSAADQIAGGSGGVALTYGADVSGFLTTGPDGVSSAPVGDGATANRIAIGSGITVPNTSATYFWWQRYDRGTGGAANDELMWETWDGTTFSKFVQMNEFSSAVAGNPAVASVNYGTGQSQTTAARDNQPRDNGPTGAGKQGSWHFYCLQIDPSSAASNAGGQPAAIFRDGLNVGTAVSSANTATASGTMTGMVLGILGRNNLGTRQLPVLGSVQGLGITSGLLNTGQMNALMAAMGS